MKTRFLDIVGNPDLRIGKNSACRDFQTVQNVFSYFSYDFLNHLIAKNQFSIIGVLL